MDVKQNLINLSHRHPIVLYDGECFLCDNSVKFILKRDRLAAFRFCTLQDATNQADLNTHLDIKNKNSVILFHNGVIYDKSDAAIHIMKLLGGWLLYFGYLASIFPKFFRNFVYNFIAKNRYKWFGKSDTCLMPNPTNKAQFLKLHTLNINFF